MQKDIKDRSSPEYQRMTWDALKKSINGIINKVNISNLKNILPELFGENVIRGRGLLARALMKAQTASPGFTRVYAAMVSVINTKMPAIGELILARLINQFLRGYRRNDKSTLLSSTKFLAHLVNQQVAGEIVALQILALLLENPTDDSVEVAVGFIKECGQELGELSADAFNNVFERFRGILHEGEIDKRVQYMIENLFAIRKRGFAEFPAKVPELDLVEEEDQITHDLNLDEEELKIEEETDYFKPDPAYETNEQKYDEIRKAILGDDDSDDDEGGGGGGDDDEEDEEEKARQAEASLEAGPLTITDETDTDLVNLRRTIYLTIMSSLDFEECAHKMLKIQFKPNQEIEVCRMILECCSQERTYLRFYGLLGQRFCMIDRAYQEQFDLCFVKQYQSIHRLETNKLRNVAKFFAHLLHSDGLPWSVLSYIHLNEEETTSSSRIFIKILFQEISEYLGLPKLNARLKDPTMEAHYSGLFPKEHPKDTRFAINFFTSIGLGGLTDELREHLRTAPKRIMEMQASAAASAAGADSSDSDSDSSSDSDSDSSDSSDSDSSDSDSDSSSDSSSSDSSSDSSSSDSDSSSSSDSDAKSRRKRRR